MTEEDWDYIKERAAAGVRMWRRVFAMRLIRFASERLTPQGDQARCVYAVYMTALAEDYKRDK